MSLYLRAILAGLFFGLWPLLMQRSGLAGYVSSTVFAVFALLTVAPFAMYEGFGSLKTAAPFFYITAGITAGVGLIFFNKMLAGATPKNVGSLFLMMIVVQITVPAIYHMYQNGLELRKLGGIVAAVIAAILLG